ncbi:hypothetical protein [Chitinasiproducens palmae]|uniref:Uncharacterized protein n=1 Tax=Chitinasiproducens palmae TaxID=1770053 RepID=A0A1H2PVP1_9BURK|nr:hypothetical protein [Chitinasiproducens palmae]SDV51344.1 hypothetical protein SAMN05216551_11686 [Chitinasiproducens palmae]
MRSIASFMRGTGRMKFRIFRALPRRRWSAWLATGGFVFSLCALPSLGHAAASDALAHAADPGDPAQVCAKAGTDDRLMPLPPSWAPAARQALGLAMPDAVMTRTTFARCMDGTAMVCNAGANLPCGKADKRTRRKDIAAYCADHRDAGMIPAYATGHDTPYTWRCVGTRAVADTAHADQLDARGFFARYWQALPGNVPKRSD